MATAAPLELETLPQKTTTLADPRSEGSGNESQDNANSQPREENAQSLEPADGGLSAWKVLLGAFTFEAILWGFPLAYGVFQNYYSQVPAFANSPLIPVVGGISSGISYLGSPFMVPLVKRFPKYQKHMIWLGWSLCIAGLVGGSFVTTLPGLMFTQGIMYGVGFVTFYYAILSMVNEWWIARRGLAFGIITGASGASGVAMPFIADALLKRYGYQTTLRSMAVGMALLTGPIIPLFKQRLPAAEQSAMSRTDWSFLKGSPFWIYGTSCLTQGLGFFFPTLYLPSYATSIGLSATEGALLVALLSIGQVTGQFTFGYLSDGRLPLNLLAVCSTVVAGVATVTLWGLANSLGPLVAFSLIYGFFAFGFVAIRPRMSMAVSENPSASLAIFSILVATQGVGNVVSGPISSGLLLSDVDPGGYGAARYKSVVIFTGSCMMLSALSTCSSYLWPRTAARRS